MTLRDRKQEEFAEEFISTKRGILDLCPRFGKCNTTITILELLNWRDDIWIFYPDSNIKDSWESDFKSRGFDTSRVKYCTHRSMKGESSGFIIVDEIHLLSEKQLEEFKGLLQNEWVLGLTGTLSDNSKRVFKWLNFPTVVSYTIDQGIKDSIIADYEINIHHVKLDNKTLQIYGKSVMTEAVKYNKITNRINFLENNGYSTKMARLERMRLLQSSEAKINKVKELMGLDRTLVFCGTIATAEMLNIPLAASTGGSRDNITLFKDGILNQLALVKLANTGVTFKELNKIIVTSFSSNSEELTQRILRAMSYEYSNPNKVAEIHIVTSDKDVELNWLGKALEFFDQAKIRVVS